MKNFLTIDVETTILNKGDPFDPRNRLCYVGLGNAQGTQVHAIDYNGEPYGEILRHIKYEIDAAETLVGFNIKFDLHWLKRYIPDLDLSGKYLYDAQIVEYLLSSQRLTMPSLDEVCKYYHLGEKITYIYDNYWSQGIDTPNIPQDELETYLRQDINLTTSLYLKQLEFIREKSEQFQSLVWLCNEDTKVLQEMEFNGMKVDKDKIEELRKATVAELEGVESELLKLCNVPVDAALNLGSPSHLSAVIYGGYINYDSHRDKTYEYKSGPKVRTVKCVRTVLMPGFAKPLQGSETVHTKLLNEYDLTQLQTEAIENYLTVPYRKYSVDEAHLKAIKPKTKAGTRIVELLLERARIAQKLETYLEKLPKLFDARQWLHDLLHGKFNQAVARTGRLSSSDPNLQNIDRTLKVIFKSKNGRLINVDAKGLEWVATAFLSGDPTARREILAGEDQHAANQAMLGLPDGEDGRLIAKIFVFRLIYGSVAEGFASDQDFIKISRDPKYWQDFIFTFYNKYKGIELFHQKLVEEYQRTGKLQLPTGRQYVYEKENLQYLRPKILNYPVQGLGHDLMAIARVSLYKKMKALGLRSQLTCTIHDSIVVDAYEDEVLRVAECIKQTWKDIPHNFEFLFGTAFTLPMECKVTVGEDLHNMEKI